MPREHGNHSVCAGRYKDIDDEDDCYHCDDLLPLAFLLTVELFNDDLGALRPHP